MKKYIIGAIALLVILFGAWYFASPTYALKGLRDAAVAGNADALEAHVDFPALRESLKSEFKAKIMEEVTKPDAGPMAALGIAFADKMLDTMLDGLMTPQGIARLIKQNQKKSSGDAKGAPEKSFDNFEIKRSGLSKFTVINPSDANSPALIFKRDGLGWKLTEIDMSNIDFPKG